ncbi:polysaccharide biosynthesis tyrosine autokinase [Actinomyces provencensis]|uniref:polysaccharide biosynthesis tyrosine autokinase n=1 Tax=Actinomyces provencensis TaxID=1720198 RepID=UPI00096A2BF8|nr:polysaccharide biosynthesis tyrosine autokinase [Actinomyces provencensis]
MTLEDFLKLTRRHLGTILVCMLVGGVGAFGLLKVTPTQYTASSTAYVRVTVPTDDGTETSANAYYNASQLATQKVKAFVPVFTSQTVAQAVIDDLKLNTTPSELAGRLTASNATNALTINVTATADTADQAREISDAVVDKAALQVKELEGEDSPVGVVLMAPAALSTIVVTPSPMKYLGAGILAGLLLGYVIAFARTTLDKRLRTVEDIQTRFEAPVLGVIPASDTIARSESDDAKDFRASESLRKLRTNLRYADVDRELRSIVITSPVQGDGKSSVASNLAKVMAAAGQDVLLVDADLRRPTARKTFGVASKVGLTQVLVGAAGLEQAISRTGVEGLSVLPAGDIPPNPSELLGSQRMSELLAYLSRDHLVIVDAAPVLPVTDAVVLAKHADGVVMVAASGSTTSDELAGALDGIQQTGGKVLGVVLNRVATSRLAHLKYGDSQYGYGYGSTYGYAQATDDGASGRTHRPGRDARPVTTERSGQSATSVPPAPSAAPAAPPATPPVERTGPAVATPAAAPAAEVTGPRASTSSTPVSRIPASPSAPRTATAGVPASRPATTPPVTTRRVGTSQRRPQRSVPGDTAQQEQWDKVVGAEQDSTAPTTPAASTRGGIKFPPLHGRS